MSRWQRLAASLLLAGLHGATARAEGAAYGHDCLVHPCKLAIAPSEFLLTVEVNGVPLPGHYVAHVHKQRMYLESSAFAAARLLRTGDVLPNGMHDDEYAPLSGVGLAWYLDVARQIIYIDAEPYRFAGTTVEVGATRSVTGTGQRQEFGGFFNYDVALERQSHRDLAAGLFELGLFSRFGVLTQTALARSREGLTRLETTWTQDLPARLMSWRLGDAVSSAGAWGRAVRFGGAQLATNFAVQPDLSVFPLPAISGTSTLPSTAEILINNSSRGTQQLPAGPFELTNIPVVAGHGTVTVLVRDLLGREQRLSQAFYASSALLRPGLVDFSLEAGAEREDFSRADAQYGRRFVAGTYRRGLSNALTVEARAEALKHQHSIGLAASLLVSDVGVLSAAAARSASDAGQGWLASVGFDRQASVLSIGSRVRMQSRDFAQLGQAQGEIPVKRLVQSYVGLYGVSLQLLDQRLYNGNRTRLIGAAKAFQLPGIGHLQFGLFQAEAPIRQRTASALLTIPLGPAQIAAASITGGATQRYEAELQQSRHGSTGYSYRVLAGAGDVDRGLAMFSWHRDTFAAQIDAARVGDRSGLRVGVTGALAWMGDRIWATRWLDQSFALVQVPGAAGVRIFADNQPVATTDADGYALLPALRPYERNALRVDPATLGWDVSIGSLARDVTPAWRSGQRVTFAVEHSRQALMTLLREDGQPVPPGARVRMQDRSYAVGFNGETFLDHLQPVTELHASWPGGSCSARVALPAQASALPDLGAVRCVQTP